MRTPRSAIAAIICLLSSGALAEPDWAQVDAAIGKKAMISSAVHRYGLPRPDLRVTLDGVSIKTALALSGWIAFQPVEHGATMMMGDLVLAENEVNPVMQSLLASGVAITAVHNHLLRMTPPVFYMHITAHGDPAKLAGAIRDALAETKTPFEPPSSGEAVPQKVDFDAARVEEILGFSGKDNNGVYQFGVPKKIEIRADGAAIAPTMGIANAINFQSTGEGKAAITGDFVATEKEVEPLLTALRSNGVEVTALHNHMLDETPRLFFTHFWANDDAIKLARAMNAALDAVHSAPRQIAHPKAEGAPR